MILNEGHHDTSICVNVTRGAPEPGNTISFRQTFVEEEGKQNIVHYGHNNT